MNETSDKTELLWKPKYCNRCGGVQTPYPSSGWHGMICICYRKGDVANAPEELENAPDLSQYRGWICPKCNRSVSPLKDSCC